MSNLKICAKCSFENKAEKKFCEGCGATLEATNSLTLSKEARGAHEASDDDIARLSACTSCGSNNPAGSNFCDQCGATLDSASKDA